MKRKVIIRSVKLFCAGALIFVAVASGSCVDDAECKTCTNSVTNESYEACGDELIEAELLPNVKCQ